MALTPKHFKALTLLEENSGLSTREIAQACGLSYDHLKHLMEGHSSAGPMGQLFKTQLNKVYDKISKRVKQNSKATQDVLIKKLRKWSEQIPATRMNDKHVKKACDILHALAKAAPRVEIGSLSITRHMNAEDLLSEFKRITSLARYVLEGSRVLGSAEGGAGELYRALASRGGLPQEPETPLLPPEFEAGEVS